MCFAVFHFIFEGDEESAHLPLCRANSLCADSLKIIAYANCVSWKDISQHMLLNLVFFSVRFVIVLLTGFFSINS